MSNFEHLKGCHSAAFFSLFLLFFPTANANEFQWQLPPGFPAPLVPTDNPMNTAKVELGRQLFFDTRLSIDNTYSCASCHKPELAFTDGLARAVGVHGELHPRSSMSLINVAYNPVFGWASRATDSLEKQILVPLFNQSPKEMGLSQPIDEVVERFLGNTSYHLQFQAAFGDDAEINLDTIAKAIAAFERTLIFGNSAYDRYVFFDEKTALDDDQKAGMTLFFSDRLGCSQCHSGFNFSGPVVFEGNLQRPLEFHNTRVYELYEGVETGLYSETNDIDDLGRFRAPMLRNIALTAPYMHDGSLKTLSEVIDHYSGGGRFKLEALPTEEKENQFQECCHIKMFNISSIEKNQLIKFLEALSRND